MNQVVCEKLELSLHYYCCFIFMLVYLVNKSRSISSLGSIIKQAKLKHNKLFVIKLMRIKFDLLLNDIIYIYIYIFVINILI